MGNYDSQYTKDFLQFYEKERLESLLDIQEDHLLDHLRIFPLRYGDHSWKRRWIHADDYVQVGAKFERVPKEPASTLTELDLACLSDAIVVERVDYAGNAPYYDEHARQKGMIFREALNNFIWGGHSFNPFVHGVFDLRGQSTGSHNDPIQIATVTTAGAWASTSNLRTDWITAAARMEEAGFHGEKAAILNPICKPMLSELISSTAVPIETWFKSTIGFQVIWDRQVDTAASVASFDAALAQLDSIVPAFTPLLVDNFLDDWKHAYVQDYEIYGTVGWNSRLYPGGSTSSGYYKGVVKLSNLSFT
jgi:hypothetical protein